MCKYPVTGFFGVWSKKQNSDGEGWEGRVAINIITTKLQSVDALRGYRGRGIQGIFCFHLSPLSVDRFS